MLRIKTESGSLYEIDQEKKTWSRPVHALSSNQVRTEGGRYISLTPPRVGQVLRMYCPPLNPVSHVRVIITTPIVEIEGEI